MTMITKLQRPCLRSRQLHTITSQETIKPSSPTPPHLKTHNLSLVDQLVPSINIPLIFFYKYYTPSDTNILKKSLSQTLTSYYPLAGRFVAPNFSAPQIDCNDQGVEFFEASNDSQLSDFILKKDVDETMDQLIPSYQVGGYKNHPFLAEVQLTRFGCGGAAVVVSMSHKVGDGFTMGSFINHWAAVARGGSPKNPTFLSSKCKFKIPEFDLKGGDEAKYAIKRFVFPNSKLNELKKKVNVTVVNPTRVEVLSSLIFSCSVSAATTVSGCLQPSNMFQIVNMRKKLIEQNRPDIAAGNIGTLAAVKIRKCGEMKLNEVIYKLRKQIEEPKEVRDVDEIGGLCLKRLSMLGLNFGCRTEGIEAIVKLEEREMAIFQQDKQILAYSQDNFA
ncbi:hypothetical protein M8C21_013258 [Ambrosia artemisiifolia]|uniref:Uncharacterized protein n=1 Tax=Ambrosia artemisiifolia TaxID=4212 RepID=A0AAD5C9E4_AMBAR|nr:hypothetical protein M8C21_013258 [Ambrosia artemisiifolia]